MQYGRPEGCNPAKQPIDERRRLRARQRFGRLKTPGSRAVHVFFVRTGTQHERVCGRWGSKSLRALRRARLHREPRQQRRREQQGWENRFRFQFQLPPCGTQPTGLFCLHLYQ